MNFYPSFQLSSSNCTCDGFSIMNCTRNGDNNRYPPVLLITTVTLCIVIGVTTIIGNSLIIAAMKMNKSLQTPTNYFIVSLALADLIIGTVLIPVSLAGSLQRPEWFYSKLFDFVLTQSFAASTFNLIAISFDRYLAITCPLRYSQLMTKRRSKVTIVIIWLASLFLSSFNFIGFHGKKIAHLVATILIFLIPFIAILFFYREIFKEAKKQKAIIKTHNRLQYVTIEFQRNRLWAGMREHRAAVTIAIVIGIFAVCWTPNMTMAILQVAWKRHDRSCVKNVTAFEAGWLVTMTIAFTNSSLNPLIYAARNYGFRQAFKKVLFCWCILVDITVKRLVNQRALQ